MPIKPEISLTIGPFIGMNDTRSEFAQDKQRASYIENMYAPAALIGGDLISRPGCTEQGLGTAVARTGTITSIDAATAAIVGSGTLFLTELAAGDVITTNGVDYTISSVSTNTAAQAAAVGPGAIGLSYTYYPGGVKAGPIYWIGQHIRTDGTYYRLALAKTTVASPGFSFTGPSSAKVLLLTYDPSNSTHPWTNRTTTSMNGIALTNAVRVYHTTLANYLILTDGTNRPRKIDLSTYALTNLTDANYAFQGPLTTYYGKLFGCDASDASTLRWSEENDPDTGWGTSTSSNSWALRQTSSDPITCLLGSNEALYCFRQNSISIITGAAASDFRSSGTVDAIQNVGTRSPDTAILVNTSVFFLDQYGRPGRISPTEGYVPLWPRIQEQLRGVALTDAQLRQAWARFDPVLNLVKVAYRSTSSSTTNDQMLVFDALTWECIGIHKVQLTTAQFATSLMPAIASPIDHAFGAVFADQNLKPRFTIAPATTTATDCGIWIQQTEDTQSSSSQDVGVLQTSTVICTVETPKIGVDVRTEKGFERITAGTRNVGGASTGVQAWYCQYRTPYATYQTSASANTKAMSLSGNKAAFDGTTVKAEYKGAGAKGRWIQIKLTSNLGAAGTTAVRSTLDTITVSGTEIDSDYARP